MTLFPSFFVDKPSRYEIDNSLRFRGAQYLSRTPGSAGNRKTWTWSGWVKRGELGAYQNIFTGGTTSPAYDGFRFTSADQLQFYQEGATTTNLITTAVFRDVSAWYHVVLKLNSTVSEAAIFVNGVEQTVTGTQPTNTDRNINNIIPHAIGAEAVNSTFLQPIEGYMAEIHFVDGQALDPTTFGEYDTRGVWVPKLVKGVNYGTNGFYLDFSDPANIGTDRSGNGNNFTATGFSTSSDWVTDSPTRNETLFNPLTRLLGNIYSYSGITGALRSFGGGSNGGGNKCFPSITPISNGKVCWHSYTFTEYIGACYHGLGYFPNQEFTSNGGGFPSKQISINTSGQFSPAGLPQTPSYTNPICTSQSSNPGSFYLWVSWNIDTGNLWAVSSSSATFPGWNGDPAAGTGAQVTNCFPPTDVELAQFIYQTALGGTFTGEIFSGGDWVPDGFNLLSATTVGQVPITNPSKHFQTVLYTGNGSTQSITGVGFQPDFVWIKGRTNTTNHVLVDSVRGATEVLESDSTTDEYTDAQSVKSFDADGFTLGTSNDVNNSAAGFNSYVAWCWKAGGTPVTNNAGSISAQVSANPTAGFSIVSWTGDGNTGTVGHGLGVAPSFIIIKDRDQAINWGVYHKNLTASKILQLNTTSAEITYSGLFNNTEPTSTVFTIGSAENDNTNKIIAYCFAEVEGYSKIGSYTGNGSSDGPFVYCGFRPAWVMIKRADTSNDWGIWDVARNTYNPLSKDLYANLSNQEFSTYNRLDCLSNGFKLRHDGVFVNASSGTYIFAAFAEHPFGGNNVSPATAR
jgi:hypothetical protein